MNHYKPILQKKTTFNRNLNEWGKVCIYLSSCKDVRVNICIGCGFAKLYDKNNIEYRIRIMDKLSDAELLVYKIRKINSNLGNGKDSK